ncbi:hypothetical protein B0H14DRAFT_3531570 [Mycena olivaceomarginata]|nr:hypothetical protein B0H14DRAFT_3531570 [Mycena olivaceomarginata]
MTSRPQHRKHMSASSALFLLAELDRLNDRVPILTVNSERRALVSNATLSVVESCSLLHIGFLVCVVWVFMDDASPSSTSLVQRVRLCEASRTVLGSGFGALSATTDHYGHAAASSVSRAQG